MKYLGLIPVLLLIAIVPAFASEPTPIELPFLPQRISVDILDEQYYLYYNGIGTVTINSVQADLDFISLVFNLDVLTDGFLIIDFDREIFGSTYMGNDDEFIILVDGDEANFTEIITTSTNRTLKIEIPTGSENMEIIGTYFINNITVNPSIPIPEPEFYEFKMKGFMINELKEKLHKASFYGIIVKNSTGSFMTDSVFKIGKKMIPLSFDDSFNFRHDVQFELAGDVKDNSHKFIGDNSTISFYAEDRLDHFGDDGVPVIFSIEGEIKTFLNDRFYDHDFFMMGKSTQIYP